MVIAAHHSIARCSTTKTNRPPALPPQTCVWWAFSHTSSTEQTNVLRTQLGHHCYVDKVDIVAVEKTDDILLSNVANHFNRVCCCCGWHCAVPLFEVTATVFGSGGGRAFWREEGRATSTASKQGQVTRHVMFTVYISKLVFPEAS